jgi:hypothetical protein
MSLQDTTNMQYSKDYYQLNKEKCRAKALAYYHKNKERLNANKRALRKGEITETMAQNPDTVPIMTIEEKRRLNNKRYHAENKEFIKTQLKTKTLQKRLAGNIPKINQQKNITKKEIAQLIGINLIPLEKILKDPKYCAPTHIATHFDGTVLFNRAEIMEWMPYVREACAFIPKGKKIKITGMAAQIVQFMRKNKKVIAYCDEIRRKQLDGRATNGQRY